jgi:hypothetical protein
MCRRWPIMAVLVAFLPILAVMRDTPARGEEPAATAPNALTANGATGEVRGGISTDSIYVLITGNDWVPTYASCRWEADVVHGTAPITYQWSVNGNEIPWGTLPWFNWYVETDDIMVSVKVIDAGQDTASDMMHVYVGLGDDC